MLQMLSGDIPRFCAGGNEVCIYTFQNSFPNCFKVEGQTHRLE